MASIRLEAIQIEVSTACTLDCSYCPVTHLPEKPAIMPLSLFKRIVPALKLATWVYLQGWGEPLLNRGIWQMAALARSSGPKVGLTTNGALLDDFNIEQALNTLDHISISMAEGFDAGPSVEKLVLRRGRRRVPRIELSYMLTKERISGLPALVEKAAALGVDGVYLTNLDYVFSHNANSQRVFAWQGGPLQEHNKLLTLAKAKASRHRLSLRVCAINAIEQATCDLDPNRFAFITVEGDVVPCVYLSRFNNPRFMQNKQVTIPRKIFGRLSEQEFMDILRDPHYEAFRKAFRDREKACRHALQILASCDASFSALQQVDKVWEVQLRQNPLPEECRGCPKAYGL